MFIVIRFPTGIVVANNTMINIAGFLLESIAKHCYILIKHYIFKYFNEKGEEQTVEYIGLTARIFLHEYDHMQGITLKHKASKLKWDLASGRKAKRTKKIVQKHVQKQLQNIQKQIDQNGNNT